MSHQHRLDTGAEFEAVIGLEVHCQLATESKIFCSCPARRVEGKSVSEIAPNLNSCPICAAHPGTLPVLNRKVVEYAIRAGLATHCTIAKNNVFARKNYFYPDLPKGYQISQYDKPICENGFIEISTGSVLRKIPIQRIHMEEDAGKSVHSGSYTTVNLNRAGVPLVEIVSGPDLRSAEEAGAYLRALYAIVTYIGICDGNLQEGNFRCDANVSVMPKGSKVLGTRAEIKNVNSFKFVEKAIEYEIVRQISVIQGGGKIVQETRTYDADQDITISMRSKEEAHDYRYFPDPDLVSVQIDDAWIERVRKSLPELPEQKKTRYVEELGLSVYDAGVLTGSQTLAGFFEQVLELLEKSGIAAKSGAKPVANLLTGEVARRLNEEAIEITQSLLKPEHLSDAVQLLQSEALSSTGAKQLLSIAWKTGEKVSVIVSREGLTQVSDVSTLEPAIDQVIAANPKQVGAFRAAPEENAKLIGFFVGQVMKATGGKANPGMLQELIKTRLLKG
ncbi:MAG: Asp-tRNA(Asn)/Glu-tRNA(Gln) amidotransferase subunit GatB [Methylotenera sp.]|nr:Asp-tRNA(Asn)/Glu-tRNA(Gln) amidotransferase subunit GatB [Oligoflexia bacterium]